ncbi:N-acetylmuramoyl-L-alanine amidase [Patescibacteria group bacterium]|nr:MAG: N-acetylmuramoyl-L-alanine amidase [Patescibacteria group bacterium]
MKKPLYIMLHHSAVSYDKNPDQFDANNNYHKAQWNFKGSLGFYLGYNYEISKTGLTRQARADGEVTAACYQKDMNDGRCIHICMDGHFDQEKPTPEQIEALRKLLKQKFEEHNIKRENLIFHRDYAPKTCPGSNLDIKNIRDLATPEGNELYAAALTLMKENNSPAIYFFGFDNMWHGLGDMDILKSLKGNYNPVEIMKVENLPDNISFSIGKQ